MTKETLSISVDLQMTLCYTSILHQWLVVITSLLYSKAYLGMNQALWREFKAIWDRLSDCIWADRQHNLFWTTVYWKQIICATNHTEILLVCDESLCKLLHGLQHMQKKTGMLWASEQPRSAAHPLTPHKEHAGRVQSDFWKPKLYLY